MEQGNYWQRALDRRISRRSAIRAAGLGTAGLAGAALVGCGADDGTTTPGTTATPSGGGAPATATATPDPSAARAGGILRQADGTDATHFSPFHPGADPSLINTWRRDFGYYDKLWHIREVEDPSRLVQLRLAESIEQQDELTYIVKMRPANFHDNPLSESNSRVNGRQLTAEDVVARYEFIAEPPASSNAFIQTNLEVTAIDDLTLQYKTFDPAAFFYEVTEGAMQRGFEVPQEMLDEDILKTHAPIGTGPFMFKNIQQGSSEEAERNPSYWMENRPYIDGKTFTLVPDQSTTEASFRAGNLDYMSFNSVRQADTIERDLGDRMTRVTYPSTSGMALMTNIRRDPFKDERVREAMHRAIDVDRIINIVYFGDAVRAWYFSPAVPTRFPIGFDAVSQHVGHDKEEAARLLSASGYDGRLLDFMVPSEVQTWVDGGRLAAEDLTDIGLNIDLVPRPRNIYLGLAGNKPLDDPNGSSDFDITMSVFLGYDHQRSNTTTFWNNASLEDDEIDALIDEIERTVDVDARRELSHRFEMALAEKHSNFIPMLSGNSHVGWNSKIRGLDFELSRPGSAGWQVEMWFDA